ncbi:ABC transporter ATP-binding protein [Calorimonas adulescens]|jgi:ABC transporter.|uniref:ABC transporter ATP-binding protein n=1 Tax=Calorimonas adulescens TaxID=2606906 RepID=A0A5D8QAG6_9THEO|nr:ABC transporter ATP-binding protein [Calorimonas adulescens]TZE81462.1 ABC transporter ATP-binding protein [Calorimonas adulescens]
MEPIINVLNVSKRYGSVKALDGVSLAIERGSIFGLLGPNGAGKSTLINIISTLIVQDDGDVEIAGLSVQKDAQKIRGMLGLVPQDIALYPTLTARENLLFWGRMYGLGGKKLKGQIDDVLELSGLKDRANERVEGYSGGMKRRLNIAVALMHSPQILIMDEPTVGIDPQSRNFILERIKSFKGSNTTVIYTSHYMEEIEEICDSVAIMDRGKVIASGTVEELHGLAGSLDTIYIKTEEPVSDLSFLKHLQSIENSYADGNTTVISVAHSKEALSSIILAFTRAGHDIRSVDMLKPNLETVFLKLTGRALRD